MTCTFWRRSAKLPLVVSPTLVILCLDILQNVAPHVELTLSVRLLPAGKDPITQQHAVYKLFMEDHCPGPPGVVKRP